MSTAIDELRSMLDERHVKWRTDISVTNKVEWTIWKSPWFKEVWAKEVDGCISIFNCSMTPAQAIEATLGRGVCSYEISSFGDGKVWFECSECGGMVSADYDPPRYCPHCGKAVRA